MNSNNSHAKPPAMPGRMAKAMLWYLTKTLLPYDSDSAVPVAGYERSVYEKKLSTYGLGL